MTAPAPTLQAFFTDRLARQKNASPHTVAAYRDTLRLLLMFVTQRTSTAPAQLHIEDLDAPLVGAFLDHLEHERGNSVRSRNSRLAAIHSLFRFAALRHPDHAALIARVLAIPPKRCDRAVVSFLTDEEIDALLAAPDTSKWIGQSRPRATARRDPDRAVDRRAFVQFLKHSCTMACIGSLRAYSELFAEAVVPRTFGCGRPSRGEGP
jgi:site-specific recombinase XerD